MNDWLNYAGSGSSRAYTNNTLSHSNVSNLVPYGSPQYYADTRLIKAYAEKMKKLKMNQIIKQSYFDMPADEFIMHTENGNVYNSLNNKLDQLYKSTQDLINLIRNMRTSYENMVTAARNTKKNVTLADSKSKMWVAAYDKIDSDIDSANISDMQKTALRNKLNNIQSSVDNIIGKLATGMEVDVSMSTLDALINEIQSSIRR